MFSNLLGMLRKVFMALSSKLYFIDFFKDAHVPMPDISGYIRERVKQLPQAMGYFINLRYSLAMRHQQLCCYQDNNLQEYLETD